MKKLIILLAILTAFISTQAQVFEVDSIVKVGRQSDSPRRIAISKEGNIIDARVNEGEARIYRGHLMVNDKAIDPQGKGSYLWPSLSPDGSKIVYWLAGHGCFVCNLDGSNSRHLGGMRAAVWAGNDAIVGMYDLDDGRMILESRLVACDISSGEKQILTPENIIALYPAASPERVAFTDLEGNLYYFNISR